MESKQTLDYSRDLYQIINILCLYIVLSKSQQ